MVSLLHSMSRDSWDAYILMELIETTPFSGSVLRDNKVSSGLCVSELGIYGYLLRIRSSENITLANHPFGHLMRTKFSHMSETGVSAGFGALDSPRLM